MVSFFVDAANLLGVPRSVAAIYGLCFASAAPLSFADLNERLDISQGSISQGIRVLREVGALKVVGSHDRREYFSPDVELRKLALRLLEERLEKQLDLGLANLKAMQGAIPEKAGASKELRARLKYLQSWHHWSRALLPVVKSFLKLS